MHSSADRLIDPEAQHAIRMLGPSPRRFRALVVTCPNGHELCTVYRSPAGLLIRGTLTAGKGRRSHIDVLATLAGYGDLLASAAKLPTGSYVVADRRHDHGHRDIWPGRDGTNFRFAWADDPEPWILQFRCRCSQAEVRPADVDRLVADTGTRRIKVAEISGK